MTSLFDFLKKPFQPHIKPGGIYEPTRALLLRPVTGDKIEILFGWSKPNRMLVIEDPVKLPSKKDSYKVKVLYKEQVYNIVVDNDRDGEGMKRVY